MNKKGTILNQETLKRLIYGNEEYQKGRTGLGDISEQIRRDMEDAKAYFEGEHDR